MNDETRSANLTPVGVLRTCYPEKFCVPRQSGLVPEAYGVVELIAPFNKPEAVRGLEGFTHVWLVTQFHLVEEDRTGLTARPPRLGGNERLGIFATRSPFRPNRLGLSVVKLDRIALSNDGVRLLVSGIDAVDGTPVLDIKPYVPYADCVANAVGGFALAQPERLVVEWDCATPDGPVRSLINATLSLNPAPAYQDEPDRVYRGAIAEWNVTWNRVGSRVVVLSCNSIPSDH